MNYTDYRWVLAALCLAGCSGKWEAVETGSSIRVSMETCKDPTPGPGGTNLVSSSWVEDKLIVVAKDRHYCGGSKLASPSFARAGEILEVRWQWETGKFVTACSCDHTIRFELANLPRRDYQIQFRK